MIAALATLLGFQLIGEAIVYALGWPIPGPVLGMALLLATLAIWRGLLDLLRPTALALLTHLSLLFVPAGVGVLVHARRIESEGVAIMVAIVVSTVLAMIVTALTVRALLREDSASGQDGEAKR